MWCSTRDHSVAVAFDENGIGREGGDGNAQHGQSVIYECLVSFVILPFLLLKRYKCMHIVRVFVANRLIMCACLCRLYDNNYPVISGRCSYFNCLHIFLSVRQVWPWSWLLWHYQEICSTLSMPLVTRPITKLIITLDRGFLRRESLLKYNLNARSKVRGARELLKSFVDNEHRMLSWRLIIASSRCKVC